MLRLFACFAYISVTVGEDVQEEELCLLAVSKSGQGTQWKRSKIYAIYFGACYYSSKSSKDDMCRQGAGCWSHQDEVTWGQGECPSGTQAINWDTTAHSPCGKRCAELVRTQIYALYHGSCYYSSESSKDDMCRQGAGCWQYQNKITWGKGECPPGTQAISWDTSGSCGKSCAQSASPTVSLASVQIYALHFGACYYSSQSSKDDMCLEGAGCWSHQDEITWGQGECPSGTRTIDWERSARAPCGKHCGRAVAMRSMPSLATTSTSAQIYALYYGTCFHSSKSSQRDMCLEGAGCWSRQHKIIWGQGRCPPRMEAYVDWDGAKRLPCGVPCVEDVTLDV